jgi:predicted metalloenzyme YecM
MKQFKIVDVLSNQTHTVNALNQEIALRLVANKVNHFALLVVSMELV